MKLTEQELFSIFKNEHFLRVYLRSPGALATRLIIFLLQKNKVCTKVYKVDKVYKVCISGRKYNICNKLKNVFILPERKYT